MEQAITWVVTGLIVGWLVRTAMKSQRDYGLIGDLVTGSLGAVVGGWLVRQLDIVTPNNLTGHIVVSIFGAGVLLAAGRIARHAVGAGLSSSPQAAALVGELEEQIRRLRPSSGAYCRACCAVEARPIPTSHSISSSPSVSVSPIASRPLAAAGRSSASS